MSQRQVKALFGTNVHAALKVVRCPHVNTLSVTSTDESAVTCKRCLRNLKRLKEAHIPTTPSNLACEATTRQACGCYLRFDDVLIYCPTHAAAPTLVAMVTTLCDEAESFRVSLPDGIKGQLRARSLWDRLEEARALLATIDQTGG